MLCSYVFINKGDISNALSGIFEDTVEEYFDIDLILKHFDDWYKKYPESYENAYVGLSIPKLISPLIRIRLLEWNPLEVNFKIMLNFKI